MRIEGVVRWFNAENGWGVIDAPEVPGGCFVHFSHVQAEGLRNLDDGENVTFTFETPGFKQDGYDHRAVQVWRRD